MPPWQPASNDPNFARRTETPCCGHLGGFLKSDPNGTQFFCSRCNTQYTMTDLLNWTGNPVRPGAGSVRMVEVTGNTYPVKEELKALGARWDNIGRVWRVPENKLQEAQRIVARGPLPNNPPWNSPGQHQGPGRPTADNPYETDEERRYREHQQAVASGRHRQEIRCCWECASSFTEHDALLKNGVWEEYWCGCLDKPRQKEVKPPPSPRVYERGDFGLCKNCGQTMEEHEIDTSDTWVCAVSPVV
jgi:hypothetical protein